MADDILINIRTVGRPEVEKAAQSIVEMGRVSEQMTGKLSLANRAIMRQVQADRQLKSTKATLRKAVRDQVITQGQMNAAMKEAHRAAREMVATDKEAIRIKKEAARKTKEQEDALHAARMEFDANYRVQQEVSRQLKALNLLYEQGTMDVEEYRAAVARVNRDAKQFYAGVADGGNQFARFNVAQYKAAQKIKKQFSTNVQQAGYQVGDFIVQVQSGQSALVAFGQQGSQMAGVFGPQGAVVGAIIAGATALGLIIQNAMKARAELDSFEDALDAIGDQSQELYEVRDALFAALVDPVKAANEEFAEYLRNVSSVKQTAFERTIDSSLAEINTSRRTTATGQNIVVDQFTDSDMAAGLQQSNQNAAARDALFNQLMTQTEDLKADLREALLLSTEAAIEPFVALTNVLEEAKKEFPNAEIFSNNAVALDKIGDETGVGRAALDQALSTLTAQAEAERQLMDENFAYEKAQEEARAQLRKDSFAQLAQAQADLMAENTKYELEQEKIREEARKQGQQRRQDAEDLGFKLRFANETALMNLQVEANKKSTKAQEKSNDYFKETLRDLKLQTAELYIQTEFHNNEEEFQQRMREMERAELRHEIMKNNLNADQAEELMEQLRRLHDQEDALEAILKKERERKEIADFLANNNPLDKQFNTRFAGEGVVMGQSVGPNTSTKTDKKGKKSPYQKALEDYNELMKTMKAELSLQEKLLGVFGEERDIQSELLKLRLKYSILGKKFDEEEIERMLRRKVELEKEQDLMEELSDTISSSMGDAFTSIIDGTKSAKDAFGDMANYIIQELFRILVVEQMVQSLKGSIGSAMTGSPAATEANGGAYMGGNRLAFANGGVVSGPTYFPMSRGRTGLMGEAGPEAIMPLSRGPDGKLGVKASGGQSVVVNQSFNFSANGDDSVKRIIAQEAPKIADMTTATIMDQRRRGGAMRKAFN